VIAGVAVEFVECGWGALYDYGLNSEGLLMNVYDPLAAKRDVTLTMNGDLVARAEAAGLSLSELAEGAVAAALAKVARVTLEAEVARACKAHDAYLAIYGSLGDAVRASASDAE
jgi:post-segregation antitoxin (ccd killing protein)